MKPSAITSTEILRSPNFVTFTALGLLSLTLLFLAGYLSPFSSSRFLSPATSIVENAEVSTVVNSTVSPIRLSPPPDKSPAPPPPPPPGVVERTGIIDETGAMTESFEIGDCDWSVVEESRNYTVKEERNGIAARVPVKRYKVCKESMSEYVPCLDNEDEIRRLNLNGRVERFDRHCPGEGKELDCVLPWPKGYQMRMPWPKSRDEVWVSNLPYSYLAGDKNGQKWISRKKDKIIFPGGGTLMDVPDQYLNRISQMVPDLAFGLHTRVALDIDCGVASFGAFLMQRNVTTLSIAPKDSNENQVQFALERGVPAMVAAFATHRLLYPSQAFDLLHCSRCRINWTHDDGILLLEANRLLRAGGYFIWAAEPVDKHEDNLQEEWKEMENLTARICWELVKKEGNIAVWRKPLNNSCYLNRGTRVQPPLCDSNDDPDNVWYVKLRPCITQLPENGYGGNVTTWPARLHNPPDRLQSIKMDAYISRKEILKAESKYWYEIIDSYVRAYHWKEMNLRNVMDMKAGFGGFAAAVHDLQIDCWVMNVVPVSGFNTLPVIYDRGLVGVMHDWCEPFDTYPRTYDLLHAAGLFSVERKRCNMSTIMLEMDRMLRPGGRVYIRDSISVMDELNNIAKALGWVSALHDTGEGPHASWKILMSEKRM